MKSLSLLQEDAIQRLRRACLDAINLLIQRGELSQEWAYDFKTHPENGKLYVLIWDPSLPEPNVAWIEAKELAASIDVANRNFNHSLIQRPS